jgi:hypothetical protein
VPLERSPTTSSPPWNRCAPACRRCPPSSSGIIDRFNDGDPDGLQVAFEHFGYGDLSDDRRRPGNKVHMMDSSGPANPPIGYHRWHAIIRATTVLGIDADRWNAIARLVALGWPI